MTVLKNTAKLVEDVPFPALTFCGSGLHMNNVEKKLVEDFNSWRVNNNKNETSKTAIYKDLEQFMEERFQIQPKKEKDPTIIGQPIIILDILDTMIAPDVDASIAANSLRQNIIACKELTTSAVDSCVYSCSRQDFELFQGESGSKCFHLSAGDSGAQFNTAGEDCANMGAQLATISHGAENQFVRDLIVDLPDGSDGCVIIGLTDLANKGIFRWQNDPTVAWTAGTAEEPIQNFWGHAQGEDQPDNGGGLEEDCVCVGKNGLWYDYPCLRNRK